MVVRELLDWHAPWPLILVVLFIGWSPHLQQGGELQFNELFAGHCAVSTGCRKHGLVGHSHDLEFHPGRRTMDILGSAGFVSASHLWVGQGRQCIRVSNPVV